MWRWTGRDRPPFAIAPGAGQESVWDYPRPPRIVADAREVTISFAGEQIARSRRALRVLETASPPTFYLPEDDIALRFVEEAEGASWCEWKGRAAYWSVRVGAELLARAAWSYPVPEAGFEALRGHIAFYPSALDCRIDGQRVRPQPGRFYAGWVSDEVVGPFKGEPGSEGW
jgi:uncharacterized protein (DUF427 family)